VSFDRSNLACSSYPIGSHACHAERYSVSMQQLKKMHLLAAAQQMRISSGGGMCPPTKPVSNLQPALQQPQPVQLQTGALPARTPTPSRSTPVPVPQHSPPNGVGRPGIAVPHVEVPKIEAVVTPPLAIGVPTSPVPSDGNVEVNNVPVRPKSQNITAPQPRGFLTNGYHPYGEHDCVVEFGSVSPSTNRARS